MDLASIENLGPSGYTLSLEEKAALRVSMLQRSREENLGKLKFWGKVFGETNDYLVAFALVPGYGFPTRKYFYCTTNDFTLSQMPALTDEWSKMAAAISMPFRGEPSLPLTATGEAGEEPPEPEAVDGEEPPAPVEVFREMHRLANLVSQIDNDVAVLPRGAFIVDAAHNVIQNKSFEGLSFEAAKSLANYYHFRTPQSARARACFEKPGLVRPSDFMDPLTEDAPKGVWSVNYDASSTMSVLRSFYWMGYYFFHVIDTAEYGGVYFGNGLPNTDLAVML